MVAVGLRAPAHRVSRSAYWYWTLREAVVGLAVTAVGFLALSGIDTGTGWDVFFGAVPFVLLAGALATAVLLPAWRWRVHRWEVTDSAIYTLEGALSRDWRIVPMSRVQTVDVEQNAVERLFSIARLVVRTASYAGSTEIAGLDVRVAHGLAAHLTTRLRESRDDGT